MKRSFNLFCLLLCCLVFPGAMVKAQATAGAADPPVAMLIDHIW